MDAASKIAAQPVVAQLSYLDDSEAHPAYRVYPPSSGRTWPRPLQTPYPTRVWDARDPEEPLHLDRQGLVMREHVAQLGDPLDPEHVKADYFPQIEALVKEVAGAIHVLAFDHNVRSVERAKRGEPGVRQPVNGAHNDYTAESGPKRVRELLEQNGLGHLLGYRSALINVWRPLHGPILDFPLSVCDARSVTPAELIDTAIEHYMEDDLSKPAHCGHIYSLRHSPTHRWYYVSRMQRNEVLIFKGYDSAHGDTARFVPHTGFQHPDCPAEFVPRESIEVRTVVVYPQAAEA